MGIPLWFAMDVLHYSYITNRDSCSGDLFIAVFSDSIVQEMLESENRIVVLLPRCESWFIFILAHLMESIRIQNVVKGSIWSYGDSGAGERESGGAGERESGGIRDGKTGRREDGKRGGREDRGCNGIIKRIE